MNHQIINRAAVGKGLKNYVKPKKLGEKELHVTESQFSAL
jgi:hypothetical protein